jgi:predicted TIM-barrel fold metal-dependent hydrolase
MSNVYAELGTTWFLMLRRPAEAAHVLGKLLVALGPERIVWGTDSIWYGSPQPLIDAFRAFTIPPSFQERWGYPALTAEIKDKILSYNAREVYGVADDTVAAAAAQSPSWVSNAAADLRRSISGSVEA